MGKGLDIETLRERLQGKSGKTYWRSLEEVANTETFQQFLHREFPKGAGEWRDDAGRRRFLKIMGASLALAGLSGCFSGPREEIVPYVDQPEQVVPGEPLFFATAVPLDGYAHGVLVESHEGRPTKVEGNPDHPASMGATNALMQASVLDLYDPDRSTSVLEGGTPSSWSTFTEAMAGELRRMRRTGGAGFRLLTGPFTSPTQKQQMQDLLERFPQAQWHLHDPTRGPGSARTGVQQALGRDARPVYHFEEAEVILSLGSDFLHAKPGSVRYAHAFAGQRRVREDKTTMNRLYAVESTPTLTGAMADHRLPLPPHRVHRFAQALAGRIGASQSASGGEMTERERTFLDEMANDLQEHAGQCVVVPGEAQPAAIHRLAHAMNQALDAVGTTVTFIEPVEAHPEEDHGGVRGLAQDIEAGDVETLLMLGTNPVYSAPADVDFQKALEQVPMSIHHGLFVNETGERSIWHVPARHYLEDWSDALAFDGTASIVQPLINPLHEACRSKHEVLSIFTAGAVRTSHDCVTTHWSERFDGDDFASFWQQALHDGVVPGTEGLDALPKYAIPGLVAPKKEQPTAAPDTATAADISPAPADTTEAPLPDTTAQQPAPLPEPPAPEGGEMELIIKPAPFMRDGEHANNAWLQELPKPLTKLVWDNAALVSPSTAEELGVENRDEVELHYQGRTVKAPVWIVPGHADGCVTIHLGYGRERAGRVGNDAGFSAYRLRTADRPWGGSGLTVEPTGTERVLATTQTHHSMEGRELVREGTLEEFQENPGFPTEGAPIELPSLYEEYEYDDYKWGMVIDSNVCTGCQACVVACQSENNIPVVGKEQVLNGREMHWLRVDRYYKGSLDNPETLFQPIPCMHCEKAPCEVVCPVNATVHDDEGLNVMVYNRCIGTRYCSNNCPYKVRRFNFLEYNREWDQDDSLKAQNNPDVTVRSRGVMEKCTYCIQRINAARIEAKKEDRRIEDGEVLTACQQACPTQAITFGDLNDNSAEVKQLEEEPHNYALLEELGTQPRTTYLAHLRHPNDALANQDERPRAEQEASPTVGEEG